MNIENGDTERLIIFEGDEASRLAREFALKNGKLNDLTSLGLTGNTEAKLKDLLDKQMRGLLPKICEEEESNNGKSLWIHLERPSKSDNL